MPKYDVIAEHISPEGTRVFPPAEVDYPQKDGERLAKKGCVVPKKAPVAKKASSDAEE